MNNPLPPRITSGKTLTLDEYQEDFQDRFWSDRTTGLWKFERRQTFQQPESPSWTAFHQGHWEQALDHIERRRDSIRNYHYRLREHGITVRRVRVVEQPLSPYLTWELHSLRLRAEHGISIRIIGPDLIAEHEQTEPLPEIVVIAPGTTYQVAYDEHGNATGALRSDDTDTADRWAEFTRALHQQGADFHEFFRTHVEGRRP